MIYVASPYYHEDSAIRQQRYEQVTAFTLALMRQNFPAYSVIMLCHPHKEAGALPDWDEQWWYYDVTLLRACASMYVVRLPGWDESKGVSMETRFCETVRMPVVHFNPRYVDGEITKYTLVDPDEWSPFAPVEVLV